MDADQVLERICNLPVDFKHGSKSPLQLVTESGVNAHPEVLTVSRLIVCLRAHPELIDQWENWSADKRVSSGWYFALRSVGFVVGYYPGGESLTFEDPFVACAEFVVREVREIVAVSRQKN